MGESAIDRIIGHDDADVDMFKLRQERDRVSIGKLRLLDKLVTIKQRMEQGQIISAHQELEKLINEL